MSFGGVNVGGEVKRGAFRGVFLLEEALDGGVARRPLAEITDFLLLQHATALGAVVHATPLVSALRVAVPGCRIVVAASGIALEVYRHHPEVDKVIETPSPLRDLKGAASALRALNPLRGTNFATITSTGNERTRIALQAMLGGAGNRVGFTVAPELYRMPMRFDHGVSQIANNLRILGALGHEIELDAETAEPRVFFADEDLASVRQMLVEGGVVEGRMIAAFVTQTSVTQRKGWRPERFGAAAKFLQERYGAQIVFVGTASEAPAIEALQAGIPFPTSSVAGKTSVTELAALLSLCDVGLALDTGTMHLGRAVGLPMVILAPAWSPPVEWLPVGDPRFRILKNLDMAQTTPDYIIDEVSVDEVKEALEELIERFKIGGREELRTVEEQAKARAKADSLRE